MAEESANKRIAKNTLFLYFRMLLVMGVSLYTSRVILASLGVVDYGIYNVVGGIVVILSFLNGCASSAMSRFLTFALGSSKEKSTTHYDYKDVFSVAFYNHIVLAVIIAIVAETIGLWYFNTKLVVPENRYEAAMWVYQISILTIFVSFTQVPYNASIIAHEKMGIFSMKMIERVKLVLLALLLKDKWTLLLYRFFYRLNSLYYRANSKIKQILRMNHA